MSNSMNSKEESIAKYKKLRGKRAGLIFVIAAGLAAMTVVAFAVGGSSVGLADIFSSIGDFITGNETVTDTQRYIALEIRLPRVLTGIAAGSSLALAGLLMQGIFQNPLVSPYTLGISSAASFGASLAIIFLSGISSVIMGSYMTPLLAFGFSVIAMVLVFVVAKVGGYSTKTLVLMGVAIGYLFSSLVSLLKYVANVDSLPDLVYWQMGSVAHTTWVQFYIILGVLAVCIILSMILSWDLNIMTLGKDEATALGVNFKRIQTITFIMTTILTAVTVSFTGVIGFVGLVAPHVTRMLVGNDYRFCVPASALTGALLLLAADTIARTVIAPSELPVGIITSIVGVPFYLYLVLRRNKNI